MFKQQLEEFEARTDHTFRKIDPPLAVDQIWLLGNMNCFAYSLELYKLPAYSVWVRKHQQNVFDQLSVLSGRFFGGLIEQGLLTEIPDTDVPVNSLVVYYHEDYVTHFGTILTRDKRVRSKFGSQEFYEHGLMEVQTSFGLPRKYLQRLTDHERKKTMAKLARLPPVNSDKFGRRG
jgi:hypothetical protein